ncbi:MAG: hypothetical protein AB1458_07305 [Bacteroidota bacterium]
MRLLRYPAEIIFIVYLLCFLFLKTGDNPWERAIDSDGKGYYAYLPALFIYHDLEYNFVESYERKYYPPDGSRFKDFRYEYKGERVNKTFSGLAILWLPFFLLAHTFSYLAGFETDGYSAPYQYAIALAALFYLWLGLKLLYRLLLRFEVPAIVSAFILFCFAFGTNLFYFTIHVPSFTHVYNFTLITAFAWCLLNLLHRDHTKWLIWSSLLLGLITAIRPTNGIIALVLPFLAGSPAGTIAFLRENFLKIQRFLAASLPAMLVLAIPVLLWYLQTGYFFVYSYGDEKFDFSDPEIINNLFSYRKGLFVYTPLAFIAVLGLIPLFRQNIFRFAVMSALLFVIVYVISSWWCWWYGASFGQRAYIDYFSLFALLLGILFASVSGKKWRVILFACCLLTVPLNLIQTYQHKKGIVPDDKVTAEIYWDNFLQLEQRARVYINNEEYLLVSEGLNSFEPHNGGTHADPGYSDSLSYRGRYAARVDRSQEFGAGNSGTLSDSERTASLLKISAELYCLEPGPEALFVAQFDSAGTVRSYYAFGFAAYTEPEKWTHVEFSCPVPPPGTADALKVYLWNPGKKNTVYMDDLRVEFFRKR